MREIKFREAIFAEPDNRFLGFHYWGWIDSEWVEPESNAPEHSMQYTGLKDKNGKEIYEGDVIFIQEYQGEGLRHAICYDKGMWMLKNNDDELDDFLTNFQKEEVEVIGNIYENPELLEVRKRPKHQNRTIPFP